MYSYASLTVNSWSFAKPTGGHWVSGGGRAVIFVPETCRDEAFGDASCETLSFEDWRSLCRDSWPCFLRRRWPSLSWCTFDCPLFCGNQLRFTKIYVEYPTCSSVTRACSIGGSAFFLLPKSPKNDLFASAIMWCRNHDRVWARKLSFLQIVIVLGSNMWDVRVQPCCCMVTLSGEVSGTSGRVCTDN